MVEELIKSPYEIISLFALQSWIDKNQETILSHHLKPEKVSPKELERISSFKSPNQVLASARIPEHPEQKINYHDLVLALDDIRDPGNLGTIIRTADWFGIETIVCSPGSTDLYNPKVIQASMGSVFRTNVVYQELVSFIQSAKMNGMKVFGSFLDGQNIYKKEKGQNSIIIIGNESRGISSDLEKLIDYRVKIPAVAKPGKDSHAESLNASVATAIICSEFRKQESTK